MKTSQKPLAGTPTVGKKNLVAAAAATTSTDGASHTKQHNGSHRRPGVSGEFRKVYMFAPQERIDAIKRGVPAEVVGLISGEMSTSKEWLIAMLGLSRAALNRKERDRKTLSKDESERVLGVQALIGQVEEMIRESGDPTGFDAAKWLSGWLQMAVPALGGKTPASYMDTIEGQKLISNLLAMGQSGAYA